MKKHLFNIFAIALAIGFSAFTIIGKLKTSPLLIFQFHGDNEKEFQTVEKWELLNNTPDIFCHEFIAAKTVCILQVDQAIASTVTNTVTLVSYLQGLAIDTFPEINDAIGQGIGVLHVKERRCAEAYFFLLLFL